MKLLVKEIFIDKETRELYQVGSVIEITDKARVKDITERGLAEIIKEERSKKK